MSAVVRSRSRSSFRSRVSYQSARVPKITPSLAENYYTPYLFLHIRFQNSCKKRQKDKKRSENGYIFNFEIHTKKGKNKKKNAHFFWNFFVFISPVPIFAFLTSKFMPKKDKNTKEAKNVSNLKCKICKVSNLKCKKRSIIHKTFLELINQ